jgi:hypothetical protein
MIDTKSKYILHEFNMSDVEDPEIYCAEPIYNWQQTPEGKFCTEKGTDLEYHIHPDPATFGYKVIITGYLSDKHATFWTLKRA